MLGTLALLSEIANDCPRLSRTVQMSIVRCGLGERERERETDRETERQREREREREREKLKRLAGNPS